MNKIGKELFFENISLFANKKMKLYIEHVISNIFLRAIVLGRGQIANNKIVSNTKKFL